MGGTCCSATDRKDFTEDHNRPAPAVLSPVPIQAFYDQYKDQMQTDVRKLFELQMKSANLIEFRIIRKSLDQKAAEHLAVLIPNMTGLTEISLVWTSLSGQGIRAMMPALEQRGETLDGICLNCNNLGDEGAEAIAASLSRLRRLHKLLLDGNQISARGGEALARGLSQSVHLGVLSLQSNKLAAKTQLALISAASTHIKMSELHLQNNKERIALPADVRSGLRVSADLVK